jgi:hypothetical protein
MSYDFDTENVYMVEFNSGKNIHVKFYELQDVMDYCSLKYPKEVIKLVYEEVYSNDEE